MIDKTALRKKKYRLTIKTILVICLVMSMIITASVYAEEWNDESIEAEDEIIDDIITSDWEIIDGKTYYYDSDGKRVTGFNAIDGDTFYFDNNGVMQTGWKKLSKKKYYFDKKSGVMTIGFKKIKKKTYYFSKKGVMQTGWKTISKRKYYFNKKGVMQTGLKKIGKNKYYLLEDGVMANIGVYKNYFISYNGKCYKIPDKKTGNQDADAKRVAKLIARCSGYGKKGIKDIDLVGRAAYYVSGLCSKCKYTMSGPYYDKAYGVFIAKEYSCAGANRALGLVLTCMGYKWTHVNENKYEHQWLTLKMDNKSGFADGQVGMVGYGKHPIQSK